MRRWVLIDLFIEVEGDTVANHYADPELLKQLLQRIERLGVKTESMRQIPCG
jgi:hypothetical protein